MLEHLVNLNDAYVFEPYLYLTRGSVLLTKSPLSAPIRNIINDGVAALHDLCRTYDRWVCGMHDLRIRYMIPLMRRIQESPWIRREIEQSEATLEIARLSLARKYDGDEMQRVLKEDQVRGAEMLAERRSKSSVLQEQLGQRERTLGGQDIRRKKTRVRREKTM